MLLLTRHSYQARREQVHSQDGCITVNPADLWRRCSWAAARCALLCCAGPCVGRTDDVRGRAAAKGAAMPPTSWDWPGRPCAAARCALLCPAVQCCALRGAHRGRARPRCREGRGRAPDQRGLPWRGRLAWGAQAAVLGAHVAAGHLRTLSLSRASAALLAVSAPAGLPHGRSAGCHAEGS